jgi:hypothetical protein
MAFDGVLAFQGKDHITASQLGRIVQGVAGTGRYVLPTLNELSATMQTANKVRIATGDLVMDGRVVTNEASVDLAVTSGTSGYKRNDLVVCKYSKDASTGVETFTAAVVKGTPTTGTPADPSVTEGDISSGSSSAVMPLWRIPIDGITAGTPVRIAPVASSLSDQADDLSALSSTVASLNSTVASATKALAVSGDCTVSQNLSSFYCTAYATPAGVVVGANSTGWAYSATNILCAVTTSTKFKNTGSITIRGAFSAAQSAVTVEYQSKKTLLIKAEQAVEMGPEKNLLNIFIPCTWSV